ncbi:uncharacterized protein LOC141873876 [Acropora palmata]|uniref:uncharacterized protein LOC141873876 n=1 Tax=Acropora palmata TaxID=6131 RepID=UPI003DA08ACA
MAPKKRKVDDSGNEAKDTKPESTERDKYFTWTDEETALLLKVAISYKTEKTTEGKDWESVKTSSTLQNGFNMLGMMMQQNHNQQYNIHPQYQQRYQQQPNDVADVWHLQDSSNYHNC